VRPPASYAIARARGAGLARASAFARLLTGHDRKGSHKPIPLSRAAPLRSSSDRCQLSCRDHQSGGASDARRSDEIPLALDHLQRGGHIVVLLTAYETLGAGFYWGGARPESARDRVLGARSNGSCAAPWPAGGDDRCEPSIGVQPVPQAGVTEGVLKQIAEQKSYSSKDRGSSLRSKPGRASRETRPEAHTLCESC
jgi:hypothetical protein